MTPNLQLQHQPKEESPKLVQGFKLPDLGVALTQEETNKRIQEFLELSEEVIKIIDKIQKEQEEERKLFLNHPTTLKINKYKELFKNDPDNLKLLNGMKVIAEDELQLIDGTVVKLGYPDIKADGKEIFERMVKNTEDEEIKAVYFKNKDNGTFKKFLEEMKQKGFRIAGNKKDITGKIAKQENQRIFDMIMKEGTPNYATIIVDILGRAFSGYRGTVWDFGSGGGEEYFWSCSPASVKDEARYCCLHRGDGTPKFDTNSREFGFGVLLFKDKTSD